MFSQLEVHRFNSVFGFALVATQEFKVPSYALISSNFVDKIVPNSRYFRLSKTNPGIPFDRQNLGLLTQQSNIEPPRTLPLLNFEPESYIGTPHCKYTSIRTATNVFSIHVN